MEKVSILMVVCKFDNVKYLMESIRSILNQSLIPNELVLVINGDFPKNVIDKLHTNFSKKIIIKTLYLDKNYGLAFALNKGINICEYELIARMDPDDISLTKRIEEQVKFMTKNNEIAASSAWIEEFTEDLKISKGIRVTPEGVITKENKYAKIRSPLNHIPSILRKSIICKVGGYPNYSKGQDYALWSLLLSKGYKLANLNLVLAHVRASNSKTDRRGISRLYTEIPILIYQYKIGFLNFYELLISIILRSLIRLMPFFIRKRLFSLLRTRN